MSPEENRQPEPEEPKPPENPPAPEKEPSTAIDLTAADIYMIVGALEMMSMTLRRIPYSTHRHRAWDYQALASRLDAKYMPLLDRTD